MCGIAGIYNLNKNIEIAIVKKMTDAIASRGPDGEGHWISEDKKICLGHRRLSIIDLSDGAAQPMHYLNRYTISFNGELYNYIELRDKLKKLGLKFYTQSDTEVVLAAFHQYKENCLQYFDGMFAFALWDNVEKKLFCARDRFGEKPFFYQYEQGNYFRFASEIKSLRTFEKTDFNRKMLFRYMVYNVAQNPADITETFFTGVFSLAPAHYLFIREGLIIENHCYWRINQEEQIDISLLEAEVKFKELFFNSVKRRLRSDVPVGSSLSGGLDSSSVVCAINELNENNLYPQNTFSARFFDSNLDEGKHINEVANFVPLNKFETWIHEGILFDEIRDVIYHIEEPLLSSSPLAQWSVMKLAKEKKVTVLLDGQGADEVLGGYMHFFRPYFAELFLSNRQEFKKQLEKYKDLRGNEFKVTYRFKLESRFRKVFEILGKMRRLFSTPDYMEFLHPDFIKNFKKIPPPFKSFNQLKDSLNFFTTEFGLEKLLSYADRNSMAFSRETRLPFLSHELVEFIFSLPNNMKINNGWTKYILRKSMEDYIPKSIAWRVDKIGFEAPTDTWLIHPKAKQLIYESKIYLEEKKLIKKDIKIKGREWMLINTALFLQTFD